MSNDDLQRVDEISSASKELDEWAVNIEALLNTDMSHLTKPLPGLNLSSQEMMPSIFGNWKNWDDFGASLLPETRKWQFVAFMARWCGLNVRSYLEHIQEKEDLIWGFYMGVDEQFRAENGKCFIEHLLGSSCFLIFAMVFLTKKGRLKDILAGEVQAIEDQRSMECYNLALFIIREQLWAINYMLTMDYQIPWFVVDAVYTKHSNLNKLLDTPIYEVALLCFDNYYPGMHKSKVHFDTNTLPRGGFKHLLHIFHWSRSPQGKFLRGKNIARPSKRMNSFYIPSATDLQLSEIIFEKHADGSIDVQYSDKILSGVMQLAPLHLFPYSTKIYKNLLIFERRYLFCGLPFTTYVACMVGLLQTKADVRLLRAKGIVPSTRNNEKDVLSYVQEFKPLLDDGVALSDDLDILLAKVMARYERKPTRYYGEFKSRYCSNPWIKISIIAAILLFALTFLQTLYSMLSYYKQ